MSVANEESLMRDGDHIGTEHILLALLIDEGALGVKTLRAQGIDVDSLRQSVVELLGPRGGEPSRNSLPQTQPTKHVIEAACEACRQSGLRFVDTGHMLLGLVRVEEGIASKLLQEHGATDEKLRTALEEVWESDGNVEQLEEATRLKQKSNRTMLLYAIVAAALLGALYYLAQ